ncbi:hypothetical protein VY88_24770 [Azospirillum thiophilum]|uniref:Uncharacterized protein n=1 Tax=Azospirillum thiophilum TaxID=528244 RepID=A0AAC8W5B2_9PROT|nr:hypothetical protein [Azospirillum thiophilum]ALG75297.1 hypothetical protein AL072_30780 [Azospirillum thiophilum]KJR62214.1 hypothetical protein VY88_24770 [Azospirillum thiophilum]
MPPDCLHPADHAAPHTAPASLPHWAGEPPAAPDGLVPGSRFHEEQWIMAAGMLARGASFLGVSRAMGCSRTTLWRAYYGSQPFRQRVWWERQALNREADLRLSSLRGLVTEQIERLVSAGDGATVRWLADRLGLFADPGEGTAPLPEPPPAGIPADGLDEDPDDDLIPGALRERVPPDAATIAAILAQPEAEGPKGVYPWTLNPDDPFPNLGTAKERKGDRGAFGRRG